MALRISRTDAIGAAFIIVGCHLALAVVNGVFSGVLLDTDAYMWVNRVIHLHENGSWFDANYPRVNPPFGHEQHWTRPFDALLWVGATLASPFVGFKAALHGWAVLIGPLLQVLALLSFLWALLPLADSKKLEALGILFACQAGIIASFMAGRSDHQILIYLLVILSIGFTTRLLLRPFRQSWCLGAGLVSAMALWVSMESLLVVFVSFIVLLLTWLQGHKDAEKKLFYYSLTFFLAIAFALFLEKGPGGFLAPFYDQISIVYVLAAGLNLALWSLAYRWRGLFDAGARRFLLLGLGGILAAVIMEWGFPGFFQGPLQAVDGLYRRIRLEHIRELQPVLSVLGDSMWAGVGNLVFWLGIALPALPVLLFQLLRREQPHRPFWLFIALGALLFLTLAIGQIRWVPYAVIFLLPAYAWLVASIVTRIELRVSGRALPALRLGVYAISIFWVFIPHLLLAMQDDGPRNRASVKCPMQAVSHYLADRETWGDRPRRVLATTDFGPELLYRTPHFVFSIPNHRFQQGFSDTYHIFNAADPEVARRIIEQRGVELILICPHYGERSIYARDDGESSFYDTLSKGQHPDWLHPVPLSAELSESVSLFEVTLEPTRQ